MPRQPRINSEYMHIVTKGVGNQIIFEDSKDYKKYLFLLRKYSKDTDIVIIAYCLMSNHVHIIVYDKNNSVSLFMKKVGVSYAQYFNRKYERTGHLFQDRFKSENIMNEKYLLSAYRYILNNPKKAGICEPNEYQWSSYTDFVRGNGFTDTKLLKELIGDNKSLQSFIKEESNDVYMEADSIKKDDNWALKILQENLHIIEGTQLQKYEKKRRNEQLLLLKEKGLSDRQIQRLTGIGRKIIRNVQERAS